MSLAAFISWRRLLEERTCVACVVRASVCAALARARYDGMVLRDAGRAQLFGAAARVFAGVVERRLNCALRFVR